MSSDTRPKHALYTESEGDGFYDIEVTLSDMTWLHRHRSEEPLLVTMTKGSYDVRQRNGGIPELRVLTVKRGVVDFEHDPSKLALVEFALPYTTMDEDYGREIVAVISDVRLYPPGVDPLTAEDDDMGVRDDSPCHYTTERGEEAHPDHPFAPYLPPERPETNALIGKIAKVVIRPHRPEED